MQKLTCEDVGCPCVDGTERQLDLFIGRVINVRIDSKLAERLLEDAVEEWTFDDTEELLDAIEKALHAA